MDRQQPLDGLLAGAQQVVQVGAAVAVGAGRARAARQQRLVGRAPARLREVDAPALGRVRDHRHPVAADPRRHRAVERVDPQLDAAHEIVDLADPEQVPRQPLRQLVDRPRDDLEHLVLVLAERAADRDPADVARRHLLRGRAPQLLLHSALHDPVDDLALRPVLGVPGQAAVEPAVRALRRARRVLAVDVERRALVEDQRDVRAERRLHLHRGLRPHELGRAVEVGAERHALLLDREDRPGALAAARLRRAALDLVGDGAMAHREDLEAAGVGDDRAVPGLEAVQAPELADQLVAGRQEQVERVPEHHVVAQLGGLAHLERLDDGLGRERHERGRAHLAVGELQRAGAGQRVRRAGVDLQGRQGAESLVGPPPPGA